MIRFIKITFTINFVDFGTLNFVHNFDFNNTIISNIRGLALFFHEQVVIYCHCIFFLV